MTYLEIHIEPPLHSYHLTSFGVSIPFHSHVNTQIWPEEYARYAQKEDEKKKRTQCSFYTDE